MVVSLELYEDTYLGAADSASLIEVIGLSNVGINPISATFSGCTDVSRAGRKFRTRHRRPPTVGR